MENKKKIKIAAAQIKPIDGDIDANLDKHFRWTERAANEGARMIVFPEMSLTGYQREMADQLSFSKEDPRLDKLKSIARQTKIIIVAGAPIKMDSKLYIGSFILMPDGNTLIYTKQFLHEGEELFFTSSFDFNPSIELENEKLSFAICADIANPAHPANASKSKTTLYVASIFYTQNGIGKGHEDLTSYSEKYAMKILMANYAGESYSLKAGGKSGFWTNEGQLTTQLTTDEDLIIVEVV